MFIEQIWKIKFYLELHSISDPDSFPSRRIRGLLPVSKRAILGVGGCFGDAPFRWIRRTKTAGDLEVSFRPVGWRRSTWYQLRRRSVFERNGGSGTAGHSGACRPDGPFQPLRWLEGRTVCDQKPTGTAGGLVVLGDAFGVFFMTSCSA